MRKTGIYILLGITISLGVFVFAGIVYFRPAVQQARLDAEQVVVAAPRKQPAVVPEAPAVPPVVEKPGASEIIPTLEPVAETEVSETLPPMEIPEVLPQEPKAEQPKPRVPSAPVMRMTVVAYEPPAQVEPETVPEPIEMAEEVEIPEDTEPVVAEEISIAVVSEPEPIPEPEVFNMPVRRIPPAPAVERSVLSVLPFRLPEPVEFIWTPVAVPEGPTEHVDPISFSKEAFERRRIAVDEVLDKLIWE